MRDRKRWRAMLMFGMPGSGKGTQGKAIGSLPGFLHVSSGEIFRQLYKAGPLGKEVEQYTSVGKLVPDDLTVRIFFNHMALMIKQGAFEPHDQIIIADGIPRTYEQAKRLDARIEVLRIYNLKLPDPEEAIARIKQRALKDGRSDDAMDEVIRDRLETFYRQTEDVLRFYDDSLVTEINASESPVQVIADIARDMASVISDPNSFSEVPSVDC